MAAHGSSSRYSMSRASMDEVRQRTAEGCQAVQAYIEHNPLSVALMAFGLGFGLGTWLGSSVVPRRQPQRPSTMAEQLGRQVLDSISGFLPESVLGHLRS